MFPSEFSYGRIATFSVALGLTFMPTSAMPAQESQMPVRGIVRPFNQAAITTDLGMRVAKLSVREAQSFKKGDVLVTFDCERLQAEQSAAAAVHREMKLGLASNKYLNRKGVVGKIDVEVSQAKVDKAASDSRALKARIKQCALTAPYSGRVAELAINEQEVPATGRPFIRIVDESQFEIDLIVPSHWISKLSSNTRFKFTVDETGVSYNARILRLGALVDPVSQTVKVIAAFENPFNKDKKQVQAGMSGSALFETLENK